MERFLTSHASCIGLRILISITSRPIRHNIILCFSFLIQLFTHSFLEQTFVNVASFRGSLGAPSTLESHTNPTHTCPSDRNSLSCVFVPAPRPFLISRSAYFMLSLTLTCFSLLTEILTHSLELGHRAAVLFVMTRLSFSAGKEVSRAGPVCLLLASVGLSCP